MPKKLGTRQARMSPDERRRQIVDAAFSFFAERGFDANTRELAARLAITQPLLFRYFPTKEDLIEAVFGVAYERLARSDWVAAVGRIEGSLRTKLVTLASAYARSNYDYDWMRLYMFAGLAGGELNRRYIRRVTLPLLTAIAGLIRGEMGRPATASDPVTNLEIDYLWLFHGGLYYGAIREHVYNLPARADAFETVVQISVDLMIEGYPRVLAPPGARRTAA